MDLAVLWAFIIAFAVIAYVILDGFDLGTGACASAASISIRGRGATA
jgi:cytochrome bd-type quinol oxidase subunit 2